MRRWRKVDHVRGGCCSIEGVLLGVGEEGGEGDEVVVVVVDVVEEWRADFGEERTVDFEEWKRKWGLEGFEGW